MNNLEKLLEIKRLQREVKPKLRIEGHTIAIHHHYDNVLISLFSTGVAVCADFSIDSDGNIELDNATGGIDTEKARAVLMAYLNTYGG